MIVDPFEFGSSISAGLRFDGRDIVTPVLRLGLDNTDGLLANEENVVGWPNVRLILTDSDTGARAEVKLVFRLYLPAGLIQHHVYFVARLLFRSTVNI